MSKVEDAGNVAWAAVLLLCLLPIYYVLGAFFFKWAWNVVIAGMMGFFSITFGQAFAILIMGKFVRWILGG